VRSLFAVVLAACASPPITINVGQADSGAIGIGLAETIDITEFEGEQCDFTLCPDDPVDHRFTATVVEGSAVIVSAVSNKPTSDNQPTGNLLFTATGVSDGSATIEIAGDGIASKRISVVTSAVGSASLSAGESNVSVASPPFVTFAESREDLDVHATYVDASGSAVAGGPTASLTTTDPSITCVQGCACATTGCWFEITVGAVGTATISVPGAYAELAVVDTTAIADFSVDQSPPFVVKVGGSEFIRLAATNPAGLSILGVGDPPTVSVDDDTNVYANADTDEFGFQRVTLDGIQVGTTVLHVLWGNAEYSYAVDVVAD
jgi:hypothetical protein